MKVFSVCVFTILFMSLAVSQEPPKAVLYDEFGFMGCDAMLGRIDAFIQEMSANPQDRAIVVTFPEYEEIPKRREVMAKGRMIIIRSRFEQARMDERLTLLLGRTSEGIKTQFWRVPPSAEAPKLDATEILQPTLNLSKPFVFGGEDENQICPTFVPRKFGELLLNHPGSKAHLVVRRGDRHSMDSKSFAAQWLETLESDAKIPRSRIKVFYAKGDHGVTYGEFWFVPAKKK
jgi:hypothetical protein